MRLSLAGWPPIASHIVAFLTGVSLTNLSHQEQLNELSHFLPKKGDQIFIQVERSRILGDHKNKIYSGKNYLVFQRKNSKETCLIAKIPIEIYSLNTEHIAIRGLKSQANTLKGLIEMIIEGGFLELHREMPEKVLCLEKAIVQYDE